MLQPHLLLEKYFTPISNKAKLANGSTRFDVIRRLCYSNKWHLNFNRDIRTIFGVKLEELFDSPEEIALYDKLWTNIEENTLGKTYVYYFTTQDIPPVSQSIQAGHVLFKLGTSLKKKKRVNPDTTYFQWIGVPNSDTLNEIKNKYSGTWNIVNFKESSLNNKLTAIAFEPMSALKRGDLINYKLLKY